MSAVGVNVAGAKPAKQPEVVLGEDWIGPDAAAESEARAKRDRRGVISMNRSPLARKIITFNLLAILVLVAGVLFLNPFRNSLVLQRERALVIEAELVTAVVEARLADLQRVSGAGLSATEARRLLTTLDVPTTADLRIYDDEGELVATSLDIPKVPSASSGLAPDARSTLIVDVLDAV